MNIIGHIAIGVILLCAAGMLGSWGFAVFGAFKPGRARRMFIYGCLAFMGFGAILMAAVEIGERWGGLTDPVHL